MKPNFPGEQLYTNMTHPYVRAPHIYLGGMAEEATADDLYAYFGGGAWEWVEARGQYYFHQFTKKQPDLNWENDDVRAAVYKMMNWWLEICG